MQIHLPVYNFSKNNVLKGNNASLIAFLHKKLLLTDLFHGDKQPVQRPCKLLFLNRFQQIIIRLHFKGLEDHLFQNRYKDEKAFKIPAAQFPCRLHAVHAFHLDVEKKNVYVFIIL